MNRSRWTGIALLVLAAAAGLLVAPRLLLAAWLAAWWWCLGVVLGCFANAWMGRLTGGRWSEALAAAASRMAGAMPWLVLALLPIALGHGWLYAWADPSGGWTREAARPAFVHAWLSPPFFLARLAIYALAWWTLARPASLASKGRAAAALLLYALLTSLAAVDLLMSLVPHWFSTAFGLVVLSAQALSGAAWSVLLLRGAPGVATRAPAQPAVPVSRDLGNLLLTWVMGWAYLAFMQFLIIWSENLPHEIAWYVPRLQTGWVVVGVVLVGVQLVLPFLALLFRSVKDRPPRLVATAVLLLGASALDAAWMVLPSVDPHTLHAWWLAPALLAGAALLLAGTTARPLTVAEWEAGHAR